MTATYNKMLSTWVKSIHAQYKKGDIDDDLVKSLNDMGLEWVLSKDVEWDKVFRLLEEYKEKMDTVMLVLLTIKVVLTDGSQHREQIIPMANFMKTDVPSWKL